MYSGDETGGLVADVGSHTSKFGFAGEDCPRLVRRTRKGSGSALSSALDEICVGVNKADHPLILTAPALLPEKDKIARTQEALETGAPAVFILRSSVAAAFATGKSTALIIDIGASGATVSPVFEGYSLLKCTKFSENFGGAAISKLVEHAVKGSYPPPGPNAPWSKEALYFDLIDDIKHTCLSVNRPAGAAEPLDSDARNVYHLPDGKVIKLGAKRKDLCESLFKNESSLSTMVYDAISACDPDLRRTMCQEIVLVGGGSLLDGLPERLGNDLAEKLPLIFKPRILSLSTNVERRFAPFVGCSVLASLGTFQQMWLSKREWDEHGERLVRERFIN